MAEEMTEEEKKKKKKHLLTRLRERIRKQMLEGKGKGTTLLTQAKQLKELGLD